MSSLEGKDAATRAVPRKGVPAETHGETLRFLVRLLDKAIESNESLIRSVVRNHAHDNVTCPSCGAYGTTQCRVLADARDKAESATYLPKIVEWIAKYDRRWVPDDWIDPTKGEIFGEYAGTYVTSKEELVEEFRKAGGEQ